MPTRTDFPSQEKLRRLCPQPRAERLNESTELVKHLGSASTVILLRSELHPCTYQQWKTSQNFLLRHAWAFPVSPA